MATTSLFDLHLGDISAMQGYRCRSYTRDSAPLVASKFSTGKQSQSDLDLLKVEGFDTMAGGMFQRLHEDNQSVARVIGFYNKFDQNLYPSPPAVSLTPVSAGYPIAKAESAAYTFASFSYSSAGNAINALYKYLPDGTVSSISMPAGTTALPVATTGWITDLQIHQGYLYMAMAHESVGVQGAWRYNIAAGTWYKIDGESTLFGVLRNVLYCSDRFGGVWTITNEFAAALATYTLITRVGNSTCPRDMKEFNGALWIAKDEGLYRFDGVSAQRVLELPTTELNVFNGALYFVSGKWLYRFDGANVTRVQYIDESFGGFTHDSQYLYMATLALASSYVTSDKFGSYSSSDYVRRIYAYDGAAFTIVNETTITGGNTYITNLYYTGAYLFDYHQGNSVYLHYKYNIASLYDPTAVTTASKLEVTASEFDDGFPSVFKALEFLGLDYYGLQSGDSFTVYYQYYDGKNWSSQLTAGTITSTSENQIEIVNNSLKLFKRIKVSVIATITNGSAMRLKGGFWRYTLQPRTRWRWQALLMAEGNSMVNDRAGNALTSDSNALTNTVLKSVKQKTPLFMFSPDYAKVKTQINSSALSFIVKGQAPIYTDPYSEYPLVAVKNNNAVWEVLRVSAVSYNSGTDETTITVLERGYYGVTAAQINADAEFHLAYKVYGKLLRDAPVLDNKTYAEQETTGESQLQREFLIELTEA